MVDLFLLPYDFILFLLRALSLLGFLKVLWRNHALDSDDKQIYKVKFNVQCALRMAVLNTCLVL